MVRQFALGIAISSVNLGLHALGTIMVDGGNLRGGARLWVDDLEGLLGLAEIGVVELHPWAATADDYEHADQLVFHLDPGTRVAWDIVTKSALALRDVLEEEEGLACWPKLTGGMP
jgi:DNA primase